MQGHPRQTGHNEEFWQNVVHWRRKWQPTPVFLPREPHGQYEKTKNMILEDEPLRSEGIWYATGEECRAVTSSFRKNEMTGPKRKQGSVVYVSGGESKVQCCKEHCIGTWNIRSTNQGKLEVVKQEMARLNINILGISELKWTRMGEFNLDDNYIYYCGQGSLRRNGVSLIINKRVWNAVFGCSVKNDRMMFVHF